MANAIYAQRRRHSAGPAFMEPEGTYSRTRVVAMHDAAMRISTFADDDEGDAGGYETRPSVALYLTPREAADLHVVLGDVIAGGNTREPGWHTHVQAWDESAEIIVFFDHDGAEQEPPIPDLSSWLYQAAADGTTFAVLVREVARDRQIDQARAAEIVRQHPAWQDRG